MSQSGEPTDTMENGTSGDCESEYEDLEVKVLKTTKRFKKGSVVRGKFNRATKAMKHVEEVPQKEKEIKVPNDNASKENGNYARDTAAAKKTLRKVGISMSIILTH